MGGEEGERERGVEEKKQQHNDEEEKGYEKVEEVNRLIRRKKREKKLNLVIVYVTWTWTLNKQVFPAAVPGRSAPDTTGANYFN